MTNAGINITNNRINKRLFCIIMLSMILFDQITKIYLDNKIQYGSMLYISSFLDLTLLYNRGAAFSFLSCQSGWQRYLFILIGIVVCITLIKLIANDNGTNRNSYYNSLGIILSGTIGNTIDRVMNGYVIDFLLFHWNGFMFPAFNFADLYICIGVIIFCYNELMPSDKDKYNL